MEQSAVGGSVPVNDEYGIGMAAGYTWTKKDLLKPISQKTCPNYWKYN